MDDRDRRTTGDKLRRAVLGDAHVDASMQRATPFTQEFQDFITRSAWGDVWSRPGLPLATRSLLTVCMLAALGRETELRLHLNGALNNGVARDEIKEAFLQVAVYCGAPAANTAFSVAQQVFAERDGAAKTPR